MNPLDQYTCECGSMEFREEQRGWLCEKVTLDADGNVAERRESYFADDGELQVICEECEAVQR